MRSGETAPEILLYYNSLVKGSMLQYSKLLSVLNACESSVINKFDINRSTDGDLADSKEKSENFLSIFLPMKKLFMVDEIVTHQLNFFLKTQHTLPLLT